jgi:hypothetical protein
LLNIPTFEEFSKTKTEKEMNDYKENLEDILESIRKDKIDARYIINDALTPLEDKMNYIIANKLSPFGMNTIYNEMSNTSSERKTRKRKKSHTKKRRKGGDRGSALLKTRHHRNRSKYTRKRL